VLGDSLAKSTADLKVHRGVKYETEVQRLTSCVLAGPGVNHSEFAELKFSSAIVLTIIGSICDSIRTDGSDLYCHDHPMT
jgi:hypothetical protein